DRHRPDRRVDPRPAELLQLLAHVDALDDLHGLRVDDLEPALAFEPVEPFGRRRDVNLADAGVVDELAVSRVVALVRLVAGLELADNAASRRVDRVNLARGRSRDQENLAVGRDYGVVGAVALYLRAPGDLAGVEVDGDDVGKARPRHVEEAAVVRGE